MNLSSMLDLPKGERSRYLAAIPLTRTFDFGCLEPNAIHFIRRTIVHNGGTWREAYFCQGLSVTATFRTHRGLINATRALAHWLNEGIRATTSQEAIEEFGLLYGDELARPGFVPALEFEVVNAINCHNEVTRKKPHHPIKGH